LRSPKGRPIGSGSSEGVPQAGIERPVAGPAFGGIADRVGRALAIDDPGVNRMDVGGFGRQIKEAAVGATAWPNGFAAFCNGVLNGPLLTPYARWSFAKPRSQVAASSVLRELAVCTSALSLFLWDLAGKLEVVHQLECLPDTCAGGKHAMVVVDHVRHAVMHA
jgi:hypothetical protein